MIKINRDKAVRCGLLTIWISLGTICIITFIDPEWLIGKSTEGRKVESNTAFRAGKKLLAKNEYKKALKAFIDAEKINKNNIDAILGQGETYIKIGANQEALETYLRALKLNPPNIHLVLYPLAEIYYNMGNVAEADKYFHKARNADSFQVHSMNKIGEMYVYDKDWDNALIAFKQVIENSGSFSSFYLDELKREMIRFNGRKQDFSGLKTLILKGSNPAELQKYDTVLFDQYIRSDQNLAVTYNQIGYVYIAKKDLDNAEKSFRTALSIWPDFTPAYNNLKMVLKDKGDTINLSKKLSL